MDTLNVILFSKCGSVDMQRIAFGGWRIQWTAFGG